MTAMLVFNGLLDVLLAAVILRAEPRRRENQLLALTAALDAARVGSIAVLVAQGMRMTDDLPMQICYVGRILVMCPVLEFTYAFPFGARPPGWVRALGLGASAAAALGALHPVTVGWVASGPFSVAFFVPFFAGTVLVARRNLARVRAEGAGGGEGTFLAALIVRFAVELNTCTIVRPFFPELLATALTLDMIVALTSTAVAGYVVLKYRFFRVGGLVTEALLRGTFWLACLALVVLATDWVAQHVHAPVARYAAFSALMFVPLGTWRLMLYGAPLLGSVLLYRFDPRRRLFKAVLDRVLEDSRGLADPAALCELTSGALSSLSGGSVVLWTVPPEDGVGWRTNLCGPVLPGELADYLRRTPVPTLHRRSLTDPAFTRAFAMLGADALVAVRAQRRLLCAFAVESRFIEQDLLATASLLADNLGNRLAHQAMREHAWELRNQLEASRRLNTLGSFAAAIAHDIRTPLTSVKMNLEMIRSWDALDADMRECTEIALEELGRMNDYVSGMLDYVKPVQLRAVEFDVWLLIAECIRTLQPLLDARRVELRLAHAEPQTPLLLRADVSRLKQVLMNLLENAADASSAGQAIQISAERCSASHLAILVRDQGHGIGASDLGRVFEPFFTTREEGTGLGLAIVSKLVRAHDGEVRVESAPERGSTFTVILPTGHELQHGQLLLHPARRPDELPEAGAAE